MNSLEEIKKRLSYVENNNLFDAHYINDMKYLIDINRLDQKNVERLMKEREEDAGQIKAHLTTCSELLKMIDLKDQAIINASVELVKFMKLVFHPNEKEYQNLKVLIEKVMSIPGMEPPEAENLYLKPENKVWIFTGGSLE